MKCIGTCKKGYIEYSEGICEKCENINKGCYECHYEEGYPINYKGIKRKRRFVCDYCEDGYIKSILGECILRSDLGLFNCQKIKEDPNDYNNYICEQCEDDYFINEKGKCEICDASHFQGKNKCIKCSDTSEGGIENCLYCEEGNEKAICQKCLTGYILSKNENSCLKIANNKELEAFTNCEQITKENDKYICSKCKYKYNLVTKNKIKECIYARSLYDVNINSQYLSNKYIYNRYSKYLPCQEAVNLVTDENPLYSCLKYYEYSNSNKDNAFPLKVTELNSSVSFCLSSDYKGFNKKIKLENCQEATLQIKNGEEIFNCTTMPNLTLDSGYQRYIYNESSKLTQRCLIHYCKTCKINDGNICEECFPGYQVVNLTGSCMEKIEVIPSITWKVFYNYVKNDENVPYINLRGTTKDQINEGHAFLIYLIFKKKNGIRNLEEEKDTIKMETICSVEKEVEKSKSNYELSMVDYKCKGNNIDNINLTFYSLMNIEYGSNENILNSQGFEELVTDLKGNDDNLEYSIRSSPSYDLSRFSNTLIFTMNEKKDFKADNHVFTIQIDGKINKDKFKKDKITFYLDIAEYSYISADCILTIESNYNADLNCNLDVEGHEEDEAFSFVNKEMIVESDIYLTLTDIDTIKLINSEYIDESDNDNDLLKKILIYGGIALGVIIIGVIIYCVIRKRGNAKQMNFTPDSNLNNINQQKNMNYNEKNSEKRNKIVLENDVSLCGRKKDSTIDEFTKKKSKKKKKKK